MVKDIDQLITKITPLYNQYKQQSKTISGTNALEIMWDIGDILKYFIQVNNIAPHKLFWRVYGNSETSKNITQNSYITREFQNRCHRIRNIFHSKSDIKKELPYLKKFTMFREAMPFFDNEKYQLKGDEKQKLLDILNSNRNNQLIIKYVKQLQSERINKQNPRTQRLGDLDNERVVFVKFYNFIYHLLKKETNAIISQLESDNIDISDIKVLAKNTNALSQDGLKFDEINTENLDNTHIWGDYAKILVKFSTQNNAKLVRRFRRVIPLTKIVNLSDMLYTLSKF